MRVKGRKVDLNQPPPDLSSSIKPGQTFVTPEKEYEVFALANFQGRTNLLILDDLRRSDWYDSWLFEVIDSTLPSDWICNTFYTSEPTIVIGPDFIAKDQEAYGRMVEGEPNEEFLFWKRLVASPNDPGSGNQT